MEMELEERGDQEPPPPEGNAPLPLAPPRSGEVTGVVAGELPKRLEEGKEGTSSRGAPLPKPQFLTPPQPREPRGAKKGEETKQPQEQRTQELKRGSSAERIAKMKPGKERDNKVVRLEDKGQLTTWQGKKGRERTISSTRSEGGSSPARKRRSSPSSSPRGSSKTSRMTEALDPVAMDVAVDNNRNSLPSAGRETAGGEASSSPSPSPETLREAFPLGSPLPLA